MTVTFAIGASVYFIHHSFPFDRAFLLNVLLSISIYFCGQAPDLRNILNTLLKFHSFALILTLIDGKKNANTKLLFRAGEK